jgi:hypothetical protein
MFVRFRQTPSRLQVSLIEGRRVGGKVRHEHIASLGSILVPATVADRIAFWNRAIERMDRLANRIGDEKEKIVSAIHARIPLFDGEDIRSVQRENAEADEKLWTTLHSGDAEMAEALKKQADQAGAHAKISGEMVAAAKDRLDRLAKGELVRGGLQKPMSRAAMLRAAGISESFMRHCERVASLGDVLFEEFVQAGIEGMHRGSKSAERKFLRKYRPK